ncbi:transporter substrate-binding domain-containing protein [Brucepastera parasyntrophica]|uniref:ATP-binding protein n=1 Tax=Brucepastera parasyntrophica TaxID=2880008 RepID=UPI00210AFB23|nr:transporter substrate-binding domain-containing protein [Brucepastera parasyntrophica]ULQ58488.1 transporter substrate-binding domain-containing protein [Brucepastera parasyntrophica]
MKKEETVLFCIFLLPLLFLLSCGAPRKTEKHPVYLSYRNIPGVTEEEILAIENLRAKHDYFLYGMNHTAEAFYRQDGTTGGYADLFSRWLSALFGIPFRPYICEWEELIAGLDSGAIHFTGELTSNPERLDKYYMTDPIAERTIKYFFVKGSEKLSVIAKERTLRFAFLKGAFTYNLVAAASADAFDPVFVESYEEAVDQLTAGTIDAFFEDGPAEAAFDIYPFIDDQIFFPLIYTPVSLSTAEAALAPVISIVQKYLQLGAIHQLIGLYNQGEEEYLRHKLFMRLDDVERNFLAVSQAENRPVMLAAEYDNYPISFYNTREKAWQGIAIDVLDEIGRLTGLEFQPVNGKHDEWPELLDMLESGKASIITELIRSNEREGRFLWTDEAYSTDYYALLSRTDHEDITINQVLYSKIGLAEETAYTEVFREWFPAHTDVVMYHSVEEAFAGLEKGEIDLFMATRNLLLSITNYLEQPGFKANLIFNRSFGSHFGFNKNQEILCSIMGKAQDLVDTETITERWIRRVFDYRRKLSRLHNSYLGGSSVLLFFILLLVLSLFHRNRQMKKKLEVTVRQRTAELEIQTHAAQVASRAKSDFLARMSHEIRTPLNAIIGMAQIINPYTQEAERVQSSINEILAASSHLLGILNDILDMSKIESGKFLLSCTPFSFQTAMEEVEKIIIQRCIEKNITLKTDLPKQDNLYVAGDKLRLKQVLINLLGNAVKFTGENGHIEFSVTADCEDSRNITLTFTITDNGIGMTPGQIEKLFIPFEQTDKSISERFGGTGLGLAISQNLISLMGGKIKVESIPEEGSAFFFTLHFEKTESVQEEISQPLLRSLDLSGKHLLLVEDIEINRLILKEMLGETNIEIREAADGVEAIKKFEESPEGYFDLIFMDIQMPRMDGYEAARLIRSMNRSDAATVPIVAMTANAYREDVERARAAGMNGHVAKPVDISKLRTILAETLKQ